MKLKARQFYCEYLVEVDLHSVIIIMYTMYVDAEAVCCAAYGRGAEEQTILPHYYDCTGGEKNLSQCDTRNRGRCSHREDASVICSKNLCIAKFVIPYTLEALYSTLMEGPMLTIIYLYDTWIL